MIELNVTIMGNPYRLACKEGEERVLKEAVSHLDSKMCALRDSGKVKGNDRIAVMAALSVTAEFLSAKSPQGPLGEKEYLVHMDRYSSFVYSELIEQLIVSPKLKGL